MIVQREFKYLGDGVYARYDGSGVLLHANDHQNPTDRIYLEPGVLMELVRYFTRCQAERGSDVV